mmetsp:Transcript_5421/g.13572  ORF Transcript_5421/g.13572 Transcript_5421/m.13572 type:complete len:300 (+) Transcript_5421:57-956(+)
MDDRKAPPQPQAMPEEDSKRPAVATPHESPPKRRKGNAGMAVSASASVDEIFDVAADLRFQPGDRVEVKWTINDEDNSEGGDEAKESEEKAKSDGEDKIVDDGKEITVWWAATLSGKTDRTHTLSDEERSEGAYDYLYKSSSVKVPIYKLNYAPLEEHGFDSHSLEDVAFISNKTLLNLSTDEMMTFRRVGAPSPPSSPSPLEEEIAKDESAIARDFNGRDEMMSFMNTLMQKCLKNTGMDKKMKGMTPAEQLVIAEKIQKAKEAFSEKMLAETDKMATGNKVITADVVHKCISQMGGE